MAEINTWFQCAVCETYMSTVIRQCTTGHSICNPCSAQLIKCPLCKLPVTKTRNLALEALAEQMKFPCANHKLGCPAVLDLKTRTLHEQFCPLRNFSCGKGGCAWLGPLRDVLKHWEVSHASLVAKASERLAWKVPAGVDAFYVDILKGFQELFWCKCMVWQGVLFVAVQLVGSAASAEKYYYKLEVTNCQRPNRYFQCFDNCCSAHVGNDELFNSKKKCIDVPVSFLKHYVGDDSWLLSFKVKVYKS